jgi:hypothetical protein
MLKGVTRFIIAVLVALLVAGCGAESSPTAPADPNHFQISGSWRFSVVTTIPPGGCIGAAIESALNTHSTGTLSITQDEITLTAIQSFDGGGSCTYRGTGGNRQGSANFIMVSCDGLHFSFQCSPVRNAAGIVTTVGTAGDVAFTSRVINSSYDLSKPIVDTLTGRLTDNFRVSYRQTVPPLDVEFVQTALAIGNFSATRR